MVEQRLLTFQQVSARLGIPEQKLLSMIRAGVLPAVRIGTRTPWRVDTQRLNERAEELKALAIDWVEPVSRPKATVHRLPEKRDAQNVRPLPPDAHTVTVAQAAEALRCSWPSIINRIREGTFRATKVNRRWQVSKADVEAAVMQKKVAHLRAKRAKRSARSKAVASGTTRSSRSCEFVVNGDAVALTLGELWRRPISLGPLRVL
jgi:excisionase family DNA binding protein